MKKTMTTIATLSLIVTLIATAVGQDRRRAPQPKGMNKADLTEQLSIRSNRQRNRRPDAIGNPIGLGGTVSAGYKQTPNQGQRAKRKSPTSSGDQPELQIANSPQQNLGDTGTHEVGHKSNRRPTPKNYSWGDSNPRVVNSQQTNAAKYDGIDGESNDARTKHPNGKRNPNFNRTETVNNNEFKSKRPYIGGSDDGSSIRGKNPRQRNNQKR